VGAILLVSHDRHFTRCVVEGAPVLSLSSDSEEGGEGEYSKDEDSEKVVL